MGGRVEARSSNMTNAALEAEGEFGCKVQKARKETENTATAVASRMSDPRNDTEKNSITIDSLINKFVGILAHRPKEFVVIPVAGWPVWDDDWPRWPDECEAAAWQGGCVTEPSWQKVDNKVNFDKKKADTDVAREDIDELLTLINTKEPSPKSGRDTPWKTAHGSAKRKSDYTSKPIKTDNKYQVLQEVPIQRFPRTKALPRVAPSGGAGRIVNDSGNVSADDQSEAEWNGAASAGDGRQQGSEQPSGSSRRSRPFLGVVWGGTTPGRQ